LGLFAPWDVCAESEKATSHPVFVATWGFSLPGMFALKAKKQQVTLFSWQLGAFAAPQR